VSNPPPDNPIYTLGHSNVPLEAVVALLRRVGVTRLVDARTAPYSKYSPQFNHEPLSRSLPEDIAYVYLGHALGGKPPADGAHALPDYEEMAARPAFQRGLEELLALRHNQVVCLLCAEEDPRKCHRSRLLGAKLLAWHGIDVQHLRHDGRVEPQSALEAEENQQPRLFG